jgi:hypothetical protein
MRWNQQQIPPPDSSVDNLSKEFTKKVRINDAINYKLHEEWMERTNECYLDIKIKFERENVV